jgi:hypothetical protein
MRILKTFLLMLLLVAITAGSAFVLLMGGWKVYVGLVDWGKWLVGWGGTSLNWLQCMLVVISVITGLAWVFVSANIIIVVFFVTDSKIMAWLRSSEERDVSVSNNSG